MARSDDALLETLHGYGSEDYLADPLFLAYFSALEAIAAFVSDIHVGPRRTRAPRVASALHAFLRELGSPDAARRLDPLIRTGNTYPAAASRADRLAAVRGIHPDGMALLGLPADCSPEDLKNAYRRAASIHHPDKGGSHDAMVALNAAFDECQAVLLPSPPVGDVTTVPVDRAGVEGLALAARGARGGKWGALNVAQFRGLALLVLIQVFDDDFAFDEAYACFQSIRRREEIEAGLRVLSALPCTETLVSGGQIDALAQRTADWLRFAGRKEEAAALAAWGLAWQPEWNRTVPLLWKSIESRAQKNIRGEPCDPWKVVITHARRADNARRLCLIDERRHLEARKKFGRMTGDRETRQATLDEYLGTQGFLERLPSEEDLPEERPVGEIPSPDVRATRYAHLTPKQRGEYRLAFSRSSTVELLAKYQSIRETEIYRSLFEHYAATPKERLRQECDILKDVIAPKDVNPAFAKMPDLLAFFEAMPDQERRVHFGHLVRLEVAAPHRFWLAQQSVEEIEEVFRGLRDGPNPADQRRQDRDGDTVSRFEKEAGKLRLLGMDGSDAAVVAREYGEYCRGLIRLGETLVYVERLQLGYFIDRLTVALVRLEEWGPAHEWLETYFALPERYRRLSPSSTEKSLRRRLERSGMEAGKAKRL